MISTGCWSYYNGEPYDVMQSEKDLQSLFHCIEANIMDRQKLIEELTVELEEAKSETYKDEELARIKNQLEMLKENTYHSFMISASEAEKVSKWKQNHDEKEHKNPNGYHRISDGGYTYKFYPTAIGTFWNCTCDICARRAIDSAYADGKYNPDAYKKYMEEHNGKIEFDYV